LTEAQKSPLKGGGDQYLSLGAYISAKMAEGQKAQRCGGVAEGQTELAKPAKGRANSEPRSIAAAG